jgi:two-component system cell cycle sensor histidine kinase/response regulator CckA
MKSELAFPFEHAAWPVLVLNEAGLIEHANPAALVILGSTASSRIPLLNFLSNQDSPEGTKAQFGPLEELSGGPISLSLRAEGSSSSRFEMYVAPWVWERGKMWLVQLFQGSNRGSIPSLNHSLESSGGGSLTGTAIHGPPGSKGLDATLAQQQKLECALQLTRTVALDFNNALTSILGHTSLVLSKMEPSHPWRSSLVEVEKSAEKAAEVASDLAAFSRQEKDTRSQITGNLNELVRRTVGLFQSPDSRGTVWSLQLEPRLYAVTFEEAKMEQAFVKILDNAVQAIGTAGQITVRTRNQDVTDQLQDENIRLCKGHYVCAEIEDSGCGISPDVLPRVFEPFFTTKNSPSHRGLGLAWVYGIVTNHGGSVAISSQPEHGTTVRVYLPAQKKIVQDRALPNDDLSGHETIMMVDDEELLLTMGEMVLSSFGYHVLTANSGQKALELFSRHQQEIDLVITDLVMPRMSGRELTGHLRQLAPQLKIICSSGYIRALHADEEELYLQKPFTSLDLLRKVKQALAHLDGS